MGTIEIVLPMLLFIAILSVEIARKKVKGPYAHCAVVSFCVAVLCTFLLTSQPVLLQICISLLLVVFGLLAIYAYSRGIEAMRGSSACAVRQDGRVSRWRLIVERCLTAASRWPGPVRVLISLCSGIMPGFLIYLIASQAMGFLLLSDSAVAIRTGAVSADCYPATGLCLIAAVVTLAVAFIFVLVFGEDKVPVGLSTGLWAGLGFMWSPMVQSMSIRVGVASICVFSGYVGGRLGFGGRHGAGSTEVRGPDPDG